MNWSALLLADPSTSLRWLVLRDLLHRPQEDAELEELAQLRLEDPLITAITKGQSLEGSWEGDLKSTGIALSRLGFLGLDASHPAVQRGANYLFSRQEPDGSWPLTGKREDSDEGDGYSMMPHQTSFPLRGLAACGYATDPRAERAYEWLLAQRLEDGAWPTGSASGVHGYVAGYRRLAHSRWGCRSNTTGALACLALHPQRCTSPEARRALDLLLGRETHDRQALGFEVARLVGAEPRRGFLTFYARYDLAFILSLAWRAGASAEDERIAGMVEFVHQCQGPLGLWDYPPRRQASRWVTFDLLRTLAGLDENANRPGEWLSLEPRTPFKAYPKKPKRY